MTLVELIVVTAVFTVLGSLTYATIASQNRTFRHEQARGTMQSDARVWGERIVKDIRRCGYDPLAVSTVASPVFAVKTATPTEFRCTSDDDGDGTLDANPREYLGFRSSGTSLEISQGSGAWRAVASGLTALAITYSNVNQAQVNATSPYDSTLDISEVSVTFALSSGVPSTPGGSEATVTEALRAAIRNFK